MGEPSPLLSRNTQLYTEVADGGQHFAVTGVNRTTVSLEEILSFTGAQAE
jgi:hypothetical protein